MIVCAKCEKVEKTDTHSVILLISTHLPHSADYPTDYSADYPVDYPHVLP